MFKVGDIVTFKKDGEFYAEFRKYCQTAVVFTEHPDNAVDAGGKPIGSLRYAVRTNTLGLEDIIDLHWLIEDDLELI